VRFSSAISASVSTAIEKENKHKNNPDQPCPNKLFMKNKKKKKKKNCEKKNHVVNSRTGAREGKGGNGNQDGNRKHL
jgi:hypothetical protein